LKIMKVSRALVVSKRTRWEFASIKFAGLSGEQLANKLVADGFPYDRIIASHRAHHKSLDNIVRSLHDIGADVRMVRAPSLLASDLDDVDVVFTAGGDGTVLETARRVKDSSIPVVTINTDPTLSTGFLCSFRLNKDVSFEDGVLKPLQGGRYSPMYRTRLQVEYGDGNISPHLSLNEIFFAERDASRPTVHETTLGSEPDESVVQRGSGVIVCTGTGSTAWMSSATLLAKSEIQRALRYAQEIKGDQFKFTDDEINQICKDLREETFFQPESKLAEYCIREPVLNGWYGEHDEPLTSRPQRGMEEHIKIKSLAWDGVLTFDGIESENVAYGETLNISVAPQEKSLFTLRLDHE